LFFRKHHATPPRLLKFILRNLIYYLPFAVFDIFNIFSNFSTFPLEEVLNENSEANAILCFLKDNYDDVIETLKKIAPNCNFLITQKLFFVGVAGKEQIKEE
jgi:hypothetical protein